jgi:hypothetical protein
MDESPGFEEKASFLAQKVTRAYLETNLDEAAKNTLAEFAARESIVSFYKAFFAKRASIYGCSEPVAFSCVNPSTCVITLVRELSEGCV